MHSILILETDTVCGNMMLCVCISHHMVYYIMCQNGWTSLMVASQNGHVEVVDKLLQHGANVDLQKKVYIRSTHHTVYTVLVWSLPAKQ